MAKNIDIGGRLHSVATEHIVAGANEIQDDSLNKTQTQINGEVNTILETYGSAIEGLNSQNYVSVEAYSELPELGSVNTVYRVGSWDGEQTDTTKYAEYAWRNTGIDQGEYVLLDVKNYGIDSEPTAGSNNFVKSEGIKQNLPILSSVGKGNDYSAGSRYVNIVPGNKYRIWICNPDISMSGVTRTESNAVRFALNSSNGTTSTRLIYVGCDTIGNPDNPNPLNDYYDITIPDDSIRISIETRSAVGTMLNCVVQDISYSDGYRGHTGEGSSSNYNLSDYTDNGWYIFFAGDLPRISDKPTGLTVGGRLIVYNSHKTGYSIQQVIIPSDGSDVYVRIGTNSWNSLLKIAKDYCDESLEPIQENINNLNKDITLSRIVGKGNTIASLSTNRCIGGHNYRIWIKNPDVPIDEVTSSDASLRFGFYYKVSGASSYTQAFQATLATRSNPLDAYYDFTLPDSSIEACVYNARCNEGEVLEVILEDLTYTSTIIEKTSMYRGHPSPSSYYYNLSDYVENGWYIIFTGDLPRIQDKPAVLTVGGKLINFNPKTSDYGKTQLFVPYSGDNFYIRNIGDSTVGEWIDFKTTLRKEIESEIYEKVSVMLLTDGVYKNNNQVTTLPSTAAELYALYDELLTNDGVSKNLIGYATATDGSDDTNLPIYEYVIDTPLQSSLITSNRLYFAPLVLLTSGIHADEKTAIMALYNFVASLFDSNNENALAIRNVVRFKIVPLINPWGLDNTTTLHEGRLNARGVNLNRNFKPYWEKGSVSERGSEPYSEKETQALTAWLQANKDAVFHLDCHNSNGYTSFYLASDCIPHKKIWSGTIRNTKNYFVSTYNWNAGYSSPYHFDELNGVAGVSSEAFIEKGINSSIIESPYGGSGGQPSSNYVSRECEIYGDFIIDLLKNQKF